MAGSSGDRLSCSGCGAPVPITGPERCRCPFCLGWNEVPPELARHFETSEALDEAMREAAESMEGARGGASAMRWAWMRSLGSTVGVLALVCGSQLFFGAQQGFGAWKDNPTMLIQPVLMGGVYAVTIASGLLNIFLSKLFESRRLRRVPFAAMDRGADPHCPSCGADLPRTGELTSRCGACETEALMPAHLVDAHLRGKHHEVAEAHKGVSHFQRGQNLGVATGQGCMGCMFLCLGGLAAIGLPAAVALLGPRAIPGMTPQTILLSGALPGLVMGGSFAYSAMHMLINAWRMARAG